jgi:hypothetical protein
MEIETTQYIPMTCATSIEDAVISNQNVVTIAITCGPCECFVFVSIYSCVCVFFFSKKKMARRVVVYVEIV